jgi:predicted RNA methylase
MVNQQMFSANSSFEAISSRDTENFPDCVDVNKKDLLISANGIMSMTTQRDSKQILTIIEDLFPSKKFVITDATANVGGDTINFALSSKVKKVNSFEINPTTFEILEHNVEVYNLTKKIRLELGNYCDKWKSVKQDIVYIDAPWGGKGYKSYKLVTLFLEGFTLNEMVDKLIKDKCCKYIALKVPSNFAISLLMIEANVGHISIHKIVRHRPYFLLIITV